MFSSLFTFFSKPCVMAKYSAVWLTTLAAKAPAAEVKSAFANEGFFKPTRY